VHLNLIKLCALINHRLQMRYLVRFGFFVGKNTSGVAISLGVMAIHKHNSITTGNETPRLP